MHLLARLLLKHYTPCGSQYIVRSNNYGLEILVHNNYNKVVYVNERIALKIGLHHLSQAPSSVDSNLLDG